MREPPTCTFLLTPPSTPRVRAVRGDLGGRGGEGVRCLSDFNPSFCPLRIFNGCMR